jgi:hypothetical protein
MDLQHLWDFLGGVVGCVPECSVGEASCCQQFLFAVKHRRDSVLFRGHDLDLRGLLCPLALGAKGCMVTDLDQNNCTETPSRLGSLALSLACCVAARKPASSTIRHCSLWDSSHLLLDAVGCRDSGFVLATVRLVW